MSTETTPRAGGNFRQLAARLGLALWQLRLAREHGLIPEPDADGRWPAEEFLDRGPEIIGAFGDQPPIGAGKAAARLALRVGLDVDPADVGVLAARGDLVMISHFQRHPIYLLRDLDALDRHGISEVVAARKGLLFDTVDAKGATLILGWSRDLFARVAGERGLRADRFGRYALADVRALASDGELNARGLSEQRDRALTKARRTVERHEDTLRSWMLRCTAYLDRESEAPPDPSRAARALRALMAARSAVSLHSGA